MLNHHPTRAISRSLSPRLAVFMLFDGDLIIPNFLDYKAGTTAKAAASRVGVCNVVKGLLFPLTAAGCLLALEGGPRGRKEGRNKEGQNAIMRLLT